MTDEPLTPAELKMLADMLKTELWVMEENEGEASGMPGWGRIFTRDTVEQYRAAVAKWRRLNGLG